MTKIEQVARAIYERRNGPGCKPWSRLPHNHQEPYLGDARAAVEAMRGPSDLMLAQWDEVDSNIYRGDAPISGGNYWDMGIDAILKEEPK